MKTILQIIVKRHLQTECTCDMQVHMQDEKFMQAVTQIIVKRHLQTNCTDYKST